MNDNNRIVQGLWVGGRLSALERLCVRSFCAHGHEFHLYHYDELQNAPRVDGLRLINGEEILPRTAIFRYRQQKSLAGFADHFRWELMRQCGGWYADMDMICLRPLDFAREIVIGYEGASHVNSAMMKFPRGHFMAVAMADACAHINKIAPWDNLSRKIRKVKRTLLFRHTAEYLKWGEAGGPAGTTLALRYFGLNKYALPVHMLYVQYHPLVDNFFDDHLHKTGALDSMLAETYVIHAMHGHFKKKGVNFDGEFPANSPYEILKRRYGEAGE